MNPINLEMAQSTVLERSAPLGVEDVKLERSLGRVLAEDIKSNRDHPPYAISAMDGFIVRSADTASAPVTLQVIADIKAGETPSITLAAGQCARIMTGAKIPAGGDAVVRVEDTVAIAPDRVEINEAVKAGNDIRAQGENLRTGAVVQTAGDEITPGVLGILAMVKCADVPVFKRPSVAILSSGDELEGLDDPFDANKIPDANSHTLMAQVQALGIEPVLLGIARDNPEDLRGKLVEGLRHDVLLVSGGTSVGIHDLVRPTLEALGVRMHFWRVKMRPGHPSAFGTTATCRVFCLPGNPVASMVSFEQLASPALRKMLGHKKLHRRTVQARLTAPLKHRPGNLEFVRVTLRLENNENLATPTGTQSSGVLRSMSLADGFLVVPEAFGALAAGDSVTVQLLNGAAYQNDGISEG